MFKVKLSPRPGVTPGRLLAKNSIISLLGMVLPLFVGILSIPFAVKGLGKEGFGILAIAWVILGYFGFFDLGLSRATTKFVSEKLDYGDLESLPSIIWTATIVSFGLGILGAIMFSLMTPFLVQRLLEIPNYLVHQTKLSFYILAFSLPVVLCSSSLRGVLESAQRFDLVNLVTIPSSMLSFIIPGLSYFLYLNLSTVIFLIVLSRAAFAIACLYLCFALFPNIRTKPILSTNDLKSMAAYGGWISITNIISPIIVYIDRFFIGTYISMASVAFYTVPSELIVRLRIFPNAIMSTLFPEVSATSVFCNTERMEMLFSRSIKYVLILLGPMLVILFIFAPSILQIWMGIEFAENSTTAFRILIIGIFFNSIATVPFVFLQGIGRPDLPAKFHLSEFPFYIVLLWFLIDRLGINGAAFACSLRSIIDSLLLYYALIKLYPRMFRQLRFGKSSSISLITMTFGFGFILYFSTVLYANLVVNIACLILFLIAFYFLTWRYFVDFTERAFLLSLLSKVKG